MVWSGLNVSAWLVWVLRGAWPAEPGRRSRSGWRSRPGREGGPKHLRSRRLVAQRPMRAHAVVMASPAFDHNSGLLEGVEDLAIQQLVPQPRIERLHIPVLPGRAPLDVGR